MVVMGETINVMKLYSLIRGKLTKPEETNTSLSSMLKFFGDSDVNPKQGPRVSEGERDAE
jgi:hypothetical protein